MNNAQLINQTSGKTEYYTPIGIVDAARRVMGGIDLDPASSCAANARIGAGKFYTIENNGLDLRWFGRIWMNHPFGRMSNPRWVEKLISEFEAGNISQALCITFACTSEVWFQPLLDFPQCFLSPRTNYDLPDGTKLRGVTKGSVITYLGHNVESFEKEFGWFGTVKVSLSRPLL